MRRNTPHRLAGFTLVEVLIGMTLSLAIMTAVLSGYLFIGRNFARLANQHTLEAASRRTLGFLEQDIRKATALSNPLVTELTLTVPTPTSTTSVRYVYSAADGTITRISSPGGSLVLQRNVQSAYFRYYDALGSPYDNSVAPFTTYTAYLSSIRQISLSVTSQTGDANNGTRTPVHQLASPRLLLRNKSYLQ